MLRVTETATKLILTGGRDELNALVNELRFRPPDYWRADAYQIYKMTNGRQGWDGYTYPLRVRMAEGTLRGEILRGHRLAIEEAAHRHNVELNLDGLLVRPFANMSPDDIPDDILVAEFRLDEHQRRCVAAWLAEANGVNKAAVSSGKTAMFMAAAAVIKRRYPDARFLYLTQSERLVRQCFKEANRFLPKWGLSQFGGGAKDESGCDMVVATAAMLHRHFDRLHKAGWFKTFMAVLADESHHVASPSLERILLATPAFFRLGASDTVAEDDIVRRTKIQGLLGPILNVVPVGSLIDAGRVARPIIYLVDVPSWTGKHAELEHAAEDGTPAWALIDKTWRKGTFVGRATEHDPDSPDGVRRDRHNNPVLIPNQHRLVLDGDNGEERLVESRWCLLNRRYDGAIVRFKERNQLIVDWAVHFSEQGRPTLVICTRTLHILILHSLMAKRLGEGKVRYLFSIHSSAERDATFQWLRETPGAVLISPLAKEGVSINEISGGVIADHVVDAEVANQYIGRFIRKKLSEDNVAHVVMFIDRQHPTYRAASLKLLKRLEKIRGFSYYHPVQAPDTVSQSTLFSSS